MLVRVVNRVGGFGMSFLGLRLARDLGMSLSTVGVVLTVFGLCTVPSRLLGGVLATRLGARSTIVLGLVVSALAQLIIALVTSIPGVVAGVLALGLAYEIIEPATQALVVESVPGTKQASTFALLWSSLAVAGVVSGLLVVVLARWGVSALFLTDAVSSLLAAAVALRSLPETRRNVVSAPWRLALTGRLVAWTGIGTMYAVLVMVVVFMLPLAVEVSGRGPRVTGGLLAVAAAAAMVAQRLVARWEESLGPASLLVIGHLLPAAGLALWANGHMAFLGVGAVLEGASGAFCLGTYQAVAGRMARPGLAAAVMTVFGMSWGIATVIAPTVGAALLSRGVGALWLSCAVVSVALAALFAASPRWSRGVVGGAT